MGEVLAVRDQYRLESWAAAIQECQASGLSNREFCRQRGIPEKNFYYWLRKIRTQVAETPQPQLVQLEEEAPSPAPEDCLRIQFKNADLKLPCGIDMDAVAALLKSIQKL